MTSRLLLNHYLLTLSLLATVGSWASAAFIDDYELDTAETSPANVFSVVHLNAAGRVDSDVKVVDEGTLSTAPVVDPFSAMNNKSLMISHDATTGSPKVLYDTIAETGNITFTTDFYIEEDDSGYSTKPYVELRIGDRGLDNTHQSTGDMAVRMRMWDSRTFIELDYGAGLLKLDNPLIFNSEFTLTLNIDTVTQTFTGDIDGTPLTDNAGAISTFAFQANVTEITGVEYVAAWSSNGDGTRFYVDNVSLTTIPEPGSLALVCLGAFVPFASRSRGFFKR